MRDLFRHSLTAFASVVITSGTIAFADPARAAEAIAPAHQVIVQVGDLNLRTTAGQKTAMRRIRAAAYHVCNAQGDGLAAQARCRAETVGTVTRALDSRVSAL